MKYLVLFAFAVVLAVPEAARAEETLTKTPQPVLPETEGVTAPLPRSTATETEPLALPRSETEAAAPYRRCKDRETVYLTN